MRHVIEVYTRFVLAHEVFFLTTILFLALAAAVGFIVATLHLKTLRRLYQAALARGEGENELEKILVYLGQAEKALADRVSGLEHEMEEARKKACFYLQHWALERYRAFKDQGGDQSFTFVLLDENKDGVILTSIYGRDESRLFAKEVEEGRARQPLSEEEARVLNLALEKKDGCKKEIAAKTKKF
ncbi:MAG: DUF4446 family protein [Bacillota bacterium]